MHNTKLLVWGNNNQNLLSMAPNQCLTKPQQIQFQFSILKLTATQKHISFISTYGQVYSYGSNTDGRLGIGVKDNYKCHYQNPMKVNLPGKAKQIKSGFSHICIQLENQDIYAWGLGQYGSLGIGQFRSKYTPTKVLVPPTIKQISCGAMHSAFLDYEGNFYMCGSNQYGQLGVKSPDKIGTPILVPFQQKVKSVACGVFYTLILTQRGQVYGMGNNKYAQLGLGHKINQYIPAHIQQLSNIVKIQAGYHSGALNSMCQLFLWGSGSFGQILRPKKFILNSPLSDLQIRGFFGIAVSDSQNKVFIWGNNTHGQLGNGGYISYKYPTQMKQISGKRLRNICCGVNFALSILQDQTQKMSIQQRSYSPVNIFSSRKYYPQQSLEGSPRRNISNDHLESSKRRGLVQQRSFTKNTQQISQSSKNYNQNIQHFARKDEDKRGSSITRNYEDLFMNLSKDYQILAKRYKQLQVEIEQRQIKRSRDQVIHTNQGLIANQNMKQELCFLQRQLIQTKQQLTVSLDKILLLQKQISLMNLKEKDSLTREKQLSLRQKQVYLRQKQVNFKQKQLESKQRQLKLQKQQLERSTRKPVKYDSPAKSLVKSPVRSPHKLIQDKTNDELIIKVQYLKKIIEDKQILLRQFQLKYHSLQGQLKDQKVYVKQIQNKYKVQRLTNDDLRKQILTLRQMIVEKQEKIDSSEQKIKKMVSETELENITRQMVTNRTKIQQLQDKCTKNQVIVINEKKTVAALQQQRTNLYKMIDNLKNQQKQAKIIHQKKIDEQKQKAGKLQDKIQSLQVQINFEKQFIKKLQQKGAQLERLRGQACKQLQRMAQNYDKEKKRRKQLEREVQKFKTTEHQLKITKQQLQKQRVLSQQYKDKVLKQYKKKDQLIKQMQSQLEQKQIQFTDAINKRDNEIQNLKQQIKSLKSKLQKQKQQVKRLNKQHSMRVEQIQNLKDQIQKLQRKLKHTKQMLQKEINQRQQLAQEIAQLKREQTKSYLARQELQKNILTLEKERADLQNQVRRSKQKVAQIQSQLNQSFHKIDAMKQENNYIRSELDQANAAVDEANKISEELSNANQQFAQNQESLNKKIQQLQAKVYELQDQNRSYTPRYDALIERNRQLDERNKQLSQMVNKAIQIQAQSYKTNILKQVELTSNKIINQVEDQKKFKQRFNRKAPEPQYFQPSQNEQNSFNRTPQVVSRVKEQPYTKYMNQKIQTHRRKVSQSAQKLAGILDLDSGMGSAYTKRGSSITKRADDEQYEKINSHMQSLKTQKQAFMQKINSFASKMKLL